MTLLLRPTLLVAAAAVCGFAWGHSDFDWLIILAAAIPLLWGLAGSRLIAGLVALAYYLSASHGLPFGVGVFFSETAPAWFGWALWFAVGLLNAALWSVFWHSDTNKRAFGALAALVISAIPPIGLLGWTNPLTASGWLFPGMGFVGLLFMASLLATLSVFRWPVVGMLAGAALVANVSDAFWPQKHNPELSSWSSLDTQFKKLQSGNIGQINTRLQYVLDLAERIPSGRVIVLPETLLPANQPAFAFTKILLDAAHDQLQLKGSTILVGTEIDYPNKPTQNVLIALGDTSAKPLVQRVPVPIGMWKPWEAQTFAAYPLASGVQRVAGHKVAYSICYEQLLVYPMLLSMAHSPEIIVGAANNWWARDTNIPVIQGQALDAWGRLFSLPVVRATNI